jgi:ATP-dependent DNA helicase RecQ
LGQQDLESELEKRFGHSAFRPGQLALVNALLEGRDALGVLPTGGGKSLCFQLPALLLKGTAVVVSPLLALMKDQVDALRARGIPAAAYNSSLDAGERAEVREELRAGRLKLLYMAPERISSEGFLSLIGDAGVSFLAIDEAHCISHWGHDFRPEYRRLGELRQLLGRGRELPIIALTATATRQVQDDIAQRLELRAPERVITGFRRPNLSFEVVQAGGREQKLRTLRERIAEATRDGGSAIVYAATRKNVEKVFEELRASPRDPNIGRYHAGLSDDDRKRAQEYFLAGRHRVLVATNAFGMGIDQHDVRLVAHFDIPGSVEAYYQEAGRAGRDGLPSRCTLLFNYADVATQEFFIDKSREELADAGVDEAAIAARTSSQRALLKQLVRYAYATECRQQLVLGYFGDPEAATPCGNCDICKPVSVSRVAVSEATSRACRQALATVARLNGRFGKVRIAEVLKGSRSQALLAVGLERQSTYGCLGAWSLERVRGVLDRLLEAGYLKMSGLDYPVLALSPSGVRAMKGEIPVELAADLDVPRSRASGAPAGAAEAAKEPLDERLLAALRELRGAEARAQGVPAYVIFHDRTLEEIARRKPADSEALAAISGMGPKKLERYGAAVLDVVDSSQS